MATMATKRPVCVSCGAPLSVPEGAAQVTCPYCTSTMVVERGAGYAARRSAEQVSQAVQDAGHETQAAVREGTYTTQAELKRLHLGQNLSTARMQLAHLQSEIRGLTRQPPDRRTRQEISKLGTQERVLHARIRELEAAIESPISSPLSSPSQVRSSISPVTR